MNGFSRRTARLAAVAALLACFGALGTLPTARAGSPDEVIMIAGTTQQWGTWDAGRELVVSGRGFSASEGELHFDIVDTTPLSSFIVSPDGTWQTSIRIPRTADGRHRVIACTPGRTGQCEQAADAMLTVTPEPTTTTSTTTATSTTTTTATTTTLPIGSTTTGPTSTTTTIGGIGISTTSTVPEGPGDVAGPSTTLGGDPVPPSTDPPLGIVTTTSQPPLVGNVPTEIENLTITEVEVNQVVQNLANEFPLISNRPTIVRAFGTSADPDGQGGVAGVLGAWKLQGGDEVPLGVVFSKNVAEWGDLLSRASHDTAPYFELPAQWAQGTVKIRVWAFAGQVNAENEPDTSDNLAELTVTFHPSALLHYYYWPLYLTDGYDPDGDPVIWTPNDGYFAEHLMLYRTWPVSAIVPHPRFTVVGDADSDWDLSEGGSYGAPNVALAEMWAQAGLDEWHQYSGMVHNDLKPDTWFDGFAGSSSGVATWSIMGVGPSGSSPWFDRSGGILAHEGAHAYGLDHAPCLYDPENLLPGEQAGGPVDPTFPAAYGWPSCTFAPPDIAGFYGIDALYQPSGTSQPTIINNHSLVGAPNEGYPMMSYRSPRWLDPWHGCQLASALEVPCTQTDLIEFDPDATPGSPTGPIPTGSSGGIPNFDCKDMVTEIDLCNFAPDAGNDPIASTGAINVVVGSVTPDDDTAVLIRVLTVPDASPTEPTDLAAPILGGPYILAVLDDDNVAQWWTVLGFKEETGHGASLDSTRGFVERIPDYPDKARIVVLSPTGVLAEIGPSDNPPTVDFDDISPESVSVSVDDPDGDTVWTTLAYRPDPTSPWTPVSAPSERTTFKVDFRDLPGSTNGEVRALATDGFHTSSAIVDGYVVPDQPPVVTVMSPTNGAVVRRGRMLDLLATAWDNEEGEIPAKNLVWSSDTDGELATGPITSTHDLSVGRHQVTVVATDSAGNKASITTTVDVLESDLPSAADRAEAELILGLSSSSELPDDDSGGSDSNTGLVVAILALVAGIGGGYALARRRS